LVFEKIFAIYSMDYEFSNVSAMQSSDCREFYKKIPSDVKHRKN
jgi:hypothetical protein